MSDFKRPGGVNHVAHVTWDTAETTRFYTEVLGMRLVSHALADQVGSSGEPCRFLHTFFEMGDGSCLAFFDIEGLPAEDRSTVVPSWARHIALSVGSLDELDDAERKLKGHGVEVVGPVDHEGIWTSIYFFDPNGIRLELTHQNRDLTDADAETAQQAVEDWTAKQQQQPAG
ncbi:VOC family protein [soil metagenome]